MMRRNGDQHRTGWAGQQICVPQNHRAHLSAAKLLDDSIRVCSSLSRRFCLPWLLLAPNQPLKRGKFISPGYNLHSAPE